MLQCESKAGRPIRKDRVALKAKNESGIANVSHFRS
jgi:hypothetical protein